jgi:sporulation protein YlmC with PRC-barrel domain
MMLAGSNGATSSSTTTVPTEWLDLRHLTGLTVYTITGDRLGRVLGAHINPVTLTIERYDLAVPLWKRWLPGRGHITADSIASCGRDVLVVRTDQPAKLRPIGHEDGTHEPGNNGCSNGTALGQPRVG